MNRIKDRLPHKILVTGGAGYIGSHTVDQLIQAGSQVWILDNFSTGHKKLVHPQAQLIEGDTRDTDLVHDQLLKNDIDSIIHFAAFTSVAESVANPEKYYDNNFGGTISLLKALERTSVDSFVFSSTAAVYADPGAQAVDESSLTNPGTPYGKSKLMSEQAIQDYSTAVANFSSQTSSSFERNFNSIILRYFNVAGASASGQWGQIGNEHTVLVKRAALAAVGKIPRLEIFGTDYPTLDGTAIRDFIHVEDLANIHLSALKHMKLKRQSVLLNCGYGHGYSVRQVIETMKRVSGRDFPVVELARRRGDLAQVIANSDRLKEQFDWCPQMDDLELICRSAFEWELKI